MPRTSLHPLGGGFIKIDTTPVRFNYTGAMQEYIVPAGVKKIAVDCVGGGNSGLGGRVTCILAVMPKQKLYIMVAQASADGYNASDIRISANDLYSRLVVAGGGGNAGSGYSNVGAGGNGGGLIGASGQAVAPSGGTGGTQTEGGKGGGGASSGGTSGANGSFGLGGAGASGGHGGAGWYGGGGGGRGRTGMGKPNTASGGGGGSSYTHPELCNNVVHTQGFNSGNGYVILTAMSK